MDDNEWPARRDAAQYWSVEQCCWVRHVELPEQRTAGEEQQPADAAT